MTGTQIEEAAMAPLKYEDYARKYAKPEDNELENEIETAKENQQERAEQEPDNAFEIPERFRGKSAEEIAKAYTELEKLNSRQGNDLGELRRQVDQLIELQSVNGQGNNTDGDQSTQEDVSIDDIYDNPTDAIGRVVESKSKATSDRIQQLEQQLLEAKVAERKKELVEKFPSFPEDVSSPEFQNWVAERPFRARMMQEADRNYDFEAAEELLSMYYDQKGKVQKQRRKQQINEASLESGSPDAPRSEETFSRRKLMELRIAAKRGDNEAAQYMNDNADSIAAAYEDGRIVD